MTVGGRSLALVEVGRAVAAIVVVVHHAESAARAFGSAAPGLLFDWGDRGVDFFFVLSGFIIFYAHHADFGVAGRADTYARKRLIRLVPSLWLIAGGWMLLHALVMTPPAADVVASTLLLYPTDTAPLPVVVWSLRHEILFYLLFWLAIAWPRLGVAAAALWLGASLVQLMFRPFDAGAPAMMLSAFNFQFAAGVLAGWLLVRAPARIGPWGVLAAAVAAIAALIVATQLLGAAKYHALDYVSPARTWWVVALALPFAALTWALARGSPRVRVPRWATFLGAASYSIYLIHLPAMSLAKPVLARLLPADLLASPWGIVPFAVAGIAAGAAFHALVERPVLRILRSRFLAAPSDATDRSRLDAVAEVVPTEQNG